MDLLTHFRFLKELLLFPLTRMGEKDLADLFDYKYDSRLLHKDEMILKVYGNIFRNFVITTQKIIVSSQVKAPNKVMDEVFIVPYNQIGTYEMYRIRVPGIKILKMVTAPGLTHYWFFKREVDLIETISIIDNYVIKVQNF